MRSDIIEGDALVVLRGMDTETVNCCVTSPPYWGQRDYHVAGQLGLEKTPSEYVEHLVNVFRDVRRALIAGGTAWIVIGDTYYQGNRGSSGEVRFSDKQASNKGSLATRRGPSLAPNRKGGIEGLKPKDLVGIPWLLAFALRADGWYWRQTIIWNKPNGFCESVKDRCTETHEYILLFTKAKYYHFNAEAIAEPLATNPGSWGRHSKKDHGKEASNPRPIWGEERGGRNGTEFGNGETRNCRSVWAVNTQAFKDEHYATFPEKLVTPCIRAGCPHGGLVLDPFCGSGTTGVVAFKEGRDFIGIDLIPAYCEMARERILRAQLAGKQETLL